MRWLIILILCFNSVCVMLAKFEAVRCCSCSCSSERCSVAAHLDGEHLVAEGAFDVLASALQYQICQFKGFIIGYMGSCMEIWIEFSFVKEYSVNCET